MTNLEKNKLLDKIREHSPIFKPSGSFRYRIRCPICGDSQKDLEDSHCYIKCSNNPDEPLLYYCFLCNAKGAVDKYFLSKLDMDDKEISNFISFKYNKIGNIKNTNIDIVTGTPILDSPQIRYIEDRLGVGFTLSDYERFKIIWDWDQLSRYISNQRVKNSLPNNMHSVSFLSDDKSSFLTRSYSDRNGRWNKTQILESDNKSFYTIKSSFDLFTKDRIEINICEGIFDALSIYKNFTSCENSVYIAVLGSDYISGVTLSIMKGIIGKNVVLKFYIDSNIDENSLKQRLKKYKWLFDDIYIYKNIKYKKDR